MQINFTKPEIPDEGALVLGVLEDEQSELLDQLHKKSKGATERALKAARFTGAKGQVVELLAPAGIDLDRVIVVGEGKSADYNPGVAENVGAQAAARLLTSGEKAATVFVQLPKDANSADD